MKFAKTLLALAAIAGSAGAFAQSANLDIGGTITASPCTLTITGGSVDLGARSTTEVQGFGLAAGFRTYPTVNRTLSVACSAPTTVAVALVDQFAASKIGEGNAGDITRFGLVNSAQSNAPLGFYAVLGNGGQTVNGAPAAGRLHAPGITGAPVWVSRGTGGALEDQSSNAWVTDVANTTPPAVTSIEYPFGVFPRVQDAAMMAQAPGGITIAGRATFTLRQL